MQCLSLLFWEDWIVRGGRAKDREEFDRYDGDNDDDDEVEIEVYENVNYM